MKVFSIFLDENRGHIIVCAEDEKEALEYFSTCSASPVIEQGIDLDDVKVEIWLEETLLTTLTKPAIISYAINL